MTHGIIISTFTQLCVKVLNDHSSVIIPLSIFVMAEDEEVWLPSVSERKYEVSSLGKVRNRVTKKVLIGRITTLGYVYVKLFGNNYHVHRLVAYAFHPHILTISEVQHVNNNKLDNRICNLQFSTREQVYRNKVKTSLKTFSKAKGVSWDKIKERWKVRISFRLSGVLKHMNLGLYESELEAAKVYDRKAQTLFGQFAKTNKKLFP